MRSKKATVGFYKNSMYLMQDERIINDHLLIDERKAILILKAWQRIHPFRKNFIDVLDDVLDYMTEVDKLTQ